MATDSATLVVRAGALGVDLEPASAERLLAYLDALLDVNRQINLTGIRDREQAVVLHVLDSLAAGRLRLRPRHCLDIGTGNGFPGVALAALHPGASVVLMDRTAKKVRAIDTCLLTAGLPGIETLVLDAAQAPARDPALRQAFDLVTVRAVCAPEAVAPLAEPLLQPGGNLLLWLEAEREMPARLGRFRRARVEPYDLPEPAARRRMLACYELG